MEFKYSVRNATVQWHKSWLANNDMQKECISQINDYINQ